MTKSFGSFPGLVALLLALALPQQSPAQQETQRHYRVELIVVRHLAGSSDSAAEGTLRDLSEILDLHAPSAELTGAATSGNAQSNVDSGESVSPQAKQAGEEPVAVRIDEMSDTMRESWRRLRGSAGFRPELFRAWEQSGDKPFPTLRIHDDEVLFSMDPAIQKSAQASAQSPQVPVDEHGALVFSDATIQRKDESGLNSQLRNQTDPSEIFYRIDGTATLTRTRFLNLDLDIELREALYERTAAESADDFAPAPEQMNPTPATQLRTGVAESASAFRIHRIQQRRQVKSEQMQYFDGPVIGVLALVTVFDVAPENLEPQTLQP